MFELNNKRLVVQSVPGQTITLLMDGRPITISFCETETIGVKDTIRDILTNAYEERFQDMLKKFQSNDTVLSQKEC